MNTCKDCKSWDAYHKDLDPSDTLGECKSYKFRESVQAVVIGFDDSWSKDAHYDGYDTSPKFGCIHWEKKDEK